MSDTTKRNKPIEGVDLDPYQIEVERLQSEPELKERIEAIRNSRRITREDLSVTVSQIPQPTELREPELHRCYVPGCERTAWWTLPRESGDEPVWVCAAHHPDDGEYSSLE